MKGRIPQWQRERNEARARWSLQREGFLADMQKQPSPIQRESERKRVLQKADDRLREFLHGDLEIQKLSIVKVGESSIKSESLTQIKLPSGALKRRP